MGIVTKQQPETEFSIKSYFLPLTSEKAITWIIILGFIVFGNTLVNGFVGDDKIYILNYLPSHFISLANAFGPSVYNTDGQYRPIAVLYFSILYTFFGTSAFFYHLFQLLLDLTSTILLFFLFRKFFPINIAFVSVLFFLIHPLQVESVAYIAQSDNELFFIFGLCALFLSLKNYISFRRLLVIFLLLLGSLLTKETGFLFFLLIISYSFIINRTNVIKLLSAGLVACVIYFFIRTNIGHVGLDTRQLSPIAMASLQGRLGTMPAIIFYYIKSFFYPASLSYDQQWIVTSLDFVHFYLPLVGDIFFLTLLGLAGVFIHRKKRKNIALFFFFLFWFFIGLGFVSQIYPLDATVADRWFYFPFAGLIGIIALCLQSVPRWRPEIKKTLLIFAMCLFLVLSVRTIVRNANYADSITLFSHDVRVSDNSNLDENLAYELLLANQYQEGIYYMQKSVNEAPNASNLYDIGNLYEQTRNYQKANYYYLLSIQHVGKTYGEDEVKKNDYDGLARILTFYDKPSTAKKFLENAIKIYPDDGSYWAFLAITEYTLGNQRGSLTAAAKAKTFLHNASANLLYYRIFHKIPLSLRT